jgi:uncharacterized protein
MTGLSEMRVGIRSYVKKTDFPDAVPVFPLSSALLLPGGQMPLNIFEPRYLAMIDEAMAGSRVIGMVQPSFSGKESQQDEPALCKIGCLGRITQFAEVDDGRYLITLTGVARFTVEDEIKANTPFRQCRISPFMGDLEPETGAEQVDRHQLLKAFRDYLDAHGMEADWESVGRANTAVLVNALSMMSPYGPAEKQALLEAPDLKTRADTLIAITEINLARKGDSGSNLQ